MANPYSLEQFITDLNRITGAETAPARIVAQARPLLERLVRTPSCIDARFTRRGATAYGRYMLHRAPRFNVTAVVWGPGDNAKAHNHETWGLVGVIENEIQETRFRRTDDGSRPGYAELEVTAVLRNEAGMVSCLLPPDDDIHEMNNVTRRNTVEIHVYGKDLTDLPRLRFDVDGRAVKTFASPKYDNC
ncbi:MAG TPA: cysteine dioxygenase family protein [candidate division Zixibacteria bacterium]|nr:cysteine dioxygenase family protein [candidate division Zixibacteria bacterium]